VPPFQFPPDRRDLHGGHLFLGHPGRLLYRPGPPGPQRGAGRAPHPAPGIAPTVVGYLLLRLLGPKRLIGAWFLEEFGIKLVMTWWSAIFGTVAVSFPLMYRTARGAFEAFDETLAHAGKTLGLSNTYIFWRVRMPVCHQGILAGTVLAFARALGEYGATSMIAGYTPGRTATIS